MNFEFTAEQEAFRKEIQQFLEAEIAAGTFVPVCDGWTHAFSPVFTKKVAARGWIGLTWPKQYGGQERPNMDRLILTEEMLRYGAPAGCHWLGDRQIGRSLLAHGTEEQKQNWLPSIVHGEMYVGLGFSEPEAGSDLGSAKVRAVEDGDYFVINGQKIWTTCAWDLTHIYLIACTDPAAPKGRGLSEFIIDAKTPGITIRPIKDLTGEEIWGEVFYDDVHIPKNSLIGQKNKGFAQILGQLDYERSGMERLMGNYPLYQGLFKYASETKYDGKPLSENPLIRSRLAQLEVDFEIGRLLTYRVVDVIDKGRSPNVEASLAKFFCTTFEQRLATIATDMLGLYGQLLPHSKYTAIKGLAPDSFLASKGYSLQGGTTEVNKNIVAGRGLGLPPIT
jgi:alkylation response protein AidB-like acyl-CoA dehydrogenase